LPLVTVKILLSTEVIKLILSIKSEPKLFSVKPSIYDGPLLVIHSPRPTTFSALTEPETYNSSPLKTSLSNFSLSVGLNKV